MRDKGKGKVAVQFAALETLQVEYVAVDSIFPNAYNPNRQSDEDFALLKQSMTDSGFTQPILVHRETKAIVDGEHRWRAARELGFQEIPVVYVDFTAEQMKLSTLRHNRARGQDDLDKLSAMLRDLEKLGGLDQAQAQLGLTKDELDGLIGDMSAAEELSNPNGTYSASWEPVAANKGDVAGEVSDTRLVGTSAKAQAATQKAEAAVAAAVTVDEKKAAQKELQSALFRLNLVFTGDDASVIRAALGTEQPSARFLQICGKALKAA